MNTLSKYKFWIGGAIGLVVVGLVIGAVGVLSLLIDPLAKPTRPPKSPQPNPSPYLTS